jgi:GDPmannose 4,6-dehydratase
MWLMLQKENPVDYVLSTGSTFSIREIIQMSFDVFGKKVEWCGEGLDEVGSIDGKVVVRIHPKYFRPAEVELLLGNSEKAYTELGWFPTYSTAETLREMVLSDYKTYNNN